MTTTTTTITTTAPALLHHDDDHNDSRVVPPPPPRRNLPRVGAMAPKKKTKKLAAETVKEEQCNYRKPLL